MDSMSQCSEDEVLVNEVVDRTPDTSSDLPSSLEKRPYLLSSDEDTGDNDDDSDFDELSNIPLFTPPKKKRGFEWRKIQQSQKNTLEQIVKGHSWHSPLRNGVVKKCVMHQDCEHFVKVLKTGEVYERGVHSTLVNVNVPKSRGISPQIIDEVDEKIREGFMPTYISNFYKSHSEYRHVAPTVLQVSNRKKFLHKSTLKVDSVKELQSYLHSKTVSIHFTDIIYFT